MLEAVEGDHTKNLAELSLAGDETENRSNVSNGSTVSHDAHKIVRLDSETCFESNLNSATKCLGFCETRRYVSFETDSRATAEYFCLLNFDEYTEDLSLSQDVSQDAWQNKAAHKSKKNNECDDNTFEFENDYIFVFANEVSEKTTTELDNALEENYMTVYVKTINGKTISIKCDKKHKAATILDEVERRSARSGDV